MANQGICNRCKATIFWFKSARTGKNYKCSSNNYRDFHKCESTVQPAEVSLEDRIRSLEERVAKLERGSYSEEAQLPLYN